MEGISIDNFISGYELVRQISTELDQYEKERSVPLCTVGRLSALSISGKEELK